MLNVYIKIILGVLQKCRKKTDKDYKIEKETQKQRKQKRENIQNAKNINGEERSTEMRQ